MPGDKHDPARYEKFAPRYENCVVHEEIYVVRCTQCVEIVPL